jgi:serine/threonine protein phosphatase PrpC
MLLAAETTCKTDTGRQRRDNEDSAFARAPVFVVADGMGGAQAGEVAARIAIEAFEHGLPGGGSPEERLANLVREANHQIFERSRADRGRAGMGTTLTAAYVDDAHVAIAHVGDSRAYLFRDGTLQRLTQDHSLVGELVRRGKLSEEQAAEHPRRSIITRALGLEPDVEVDTWTYPARAGDVILLCSDGLTSMISEERVRDILESNPNLDAVADTLINEANEAGGRDNITVILSRLEELDADDPAADKETMVGLSRARPTGATRAVATTGAVPPAPTNPVARWRSRWPGCPCDKTQEDISDKPPRRIRHRWLVPRWHDRSSHNGNSCDILTA